MIRLMPCFAPDEIEARSFAIIDAEAPSPKPFEGDLWSIARRLVHTCADFDILHSLVLDDHACTTGIAALRRGCAIFTDTEMARHGMTSRRLSPLGCSVTSLLSLPGVPDALEGSIVAIGNAPTALIALMEHLDTGGARPALVIGMPVGFVNAAESKELLYERHDIPRIVLRGRKGGSPLVAATVNALAVLATRQD